jgi:hypothetical protein
VFLKKLKYVIEKLTMSYSEPPPDGSTMYNSNKKRLSIDKLDEIFAGMHTQEINAFPQKFQE